MSDPAADPLPADWAAYRRDVDLDAYERKWERLAEEGVELHGEVALVRSYAPQAVLDAGCGTGRITVELARHGIEVVGADGDPGMIDRARSKAPDLPWIVADLADLALPDRFAVVLLAGNVVPYVVADRRAAAVSACARHLAPGGVMIAGFVLRPDWPDLAAYDGWCTAADLELADRWSTWDRAPYTGGNYAVSVHVRAGE